MTNRGKTALIACIAALAGYGAFSTIASYYFANEFWSNAGVTALREILNTNGVFTYGTVQSMDASSSVLTFSTLNPMTGSAQNISAIVTNQTLIQKEELQADASGNYVGLSPLSDGAVSDLTPGTKVAVTLERSGNSLVATIILFGNPL